MLTVILFIVAFVAFMISALAGGGAGLMLLPILGAMLPVAQVPAALSIGTATSSLARMVTFYRSIRWSICLWFIPASIPSVWLGAWLLTYINPLYIEGIVGLFLVSNLPFLFQRKPTERTLGQLSKPYVMTIGLAAGFVSGLTGAVGLLFNKFYLRIGLSKEEIVATRAANEILIHGFKLVLYTTFGLMNVEVIKVGAVVAVAAILGSLMSKKLLLKISETLFQKVAYGAMVVSGISLLLGASYRLSTANTASIAFIPVSNGVETRLQWRQGFFTIELEFNEGFEYEHSITMADLPKEKQQIAQKLIAGADRFYLEEVFGMGEHSYEVYIIRNGVLQKEEF